MIRSLPRAILFMIAVYLIAPSLRADERKPASPSEVFGRDNLVAWCIVPFDAKKRGPEERAAMLRRLGFKRFAYDWRSEHVPTFDAEMEALQRHGIALEAFWFPATVEGDGRRILDLLAKHKIHTQLWVTMPDPTPATLTQKEKIEAAERTLLPIADAAGKIGCKVGLYNHGGWFGEPESQLAILERMRRPNVGMVYNFHHAHKQIDRLSELLPRMIPHLYGINLNGTRRNHDGSTPEILPLGQGELDLQILRTILASGYRGPLGILGHTMNDAEDQLNDNLDGLDWLVPQLEGKPVGSRPIPRTVKTGAGAGMLFDPAVVNRLVSEAKAAGDARRGASVFGAPQFACISCHRIGTQGGTIGPDLSTIGKCQTPEQIAESVLWPKRQVKDEYIAWNVITSNGKSITGYKEKEDAKELVLRDPALGTLTPIGKREIDERRQVGTLMPEGLAAAMSPEQRRDLIRFLTELGRGDGSHAEMLAGHVSAPTTFAYDRAPLDPARWPSWQSFVNRDRVYDFYQKEAEYFGRQSTQSALLPEYPGLDGGKLGHWGNQNEATWADGRWNSTDLGSVMCGVFHGPGLTVPKAVCVRLGEKGELSACFNPLTLSYEALWQGGFLKFSAVRHGFFDGLLMDGSFLPRPEGKKPDKPFVYHGYYRHGKRVVFAYRIGDVEWLDAPWVENGHFTRQLAPAERHLFAVCKKGGPAQWPQVFETHGTLGKGGPYAVDNIPPPFDNPWRSLLFFGGHDFLPDGTAFLCTMQGDVWRVEGLDSGLEHVRWKRFASGLHQALGLVVADGQIYVMGRDQITRLHDLNGDGEADFYECFSNAYITSPPGHDFICGLERDTTGRFYIASGNQGLLRISADGSRYDVLATGIRNPDGLGLLPDGSITVPCSEGDWTPASMIAMVHPENGLAYFGHGGPRNGKPPSLPLVYLPRGIDNSSGGQVHVSGDRWGPLTGQLVHLSYGAATVYLLLREQVQGQDQGAIVPLTGEFRAGVHRGRFNPKDGQLYVSGMGGWGTYSTDDGCFQRVRYTGAPVQLPISFHAHENGVLVSFTQPVVRSLVENPHSHFAQVWNYLYSSAYGSAEYSSRHPGTPGHDPSKIASAHALADDHTVFLEIPDLQSVNQLHLHMRVDAGPAIQLFATVHRLAAPFTQFEGYHPIIKTIAAHPILSDLAQATPPPPNPWRRAIPNAHSFEMQAGSNLTFTPRTFTVKASEPVRLTFTNPDVVPHNWVLIKPGSLERFGMLVNQLVAEPDAVTRQYVPPSEDVIVYSDIVQPGQHFAVYFRAPKQKGRFPYLCTFPGHWMVMNGEMIVE